VTHFAPALETYVSFAECQIERVAKQQTSVKSRDTSQIVLPKRNVDGDAKRHAAFIARSFEGGKASGRRKRRPRLDDALAREDIECRAASES